MGRANPFSKLILPFLLIFVNCWGTSTDILQYSSRSDDPAFFNEVLSRGSGFRTSVKRIHAGIVSHHLFVAGYISDYFAAIKKIDDSGLIKTFIIIGPNHRSRGNALISLSERQWKTPYGFLKPDLSMVRELCRLNGASIDEDAFYNEHSIGALLPFIAYYFPGVKIVPIVLNFRLSWEGAELLGKAIARLTGGSDIVILSADFVHERLNRAAQILDRKSGRLLRRPLEDHSPDEISGIEIDCRKGLMTLFNFMRGKKKCRAEILLNTNYAVVSGKDDPATSYFFVIYGEIK